MKFLYKLEKKFGKYAVDNLSTKVVILFCISYFLWMALPELYEFLVFDTVYVFAGHQYWRIFTWIFTIPGGVSVFTFLMLFVYASIGNNVERSVGTFLYNIYIFGLILFLTVAQLVAGYIEYLEMPEIYDAVYQVSKETGEVIYGQDYLGYVSNFGPTYFISMSVFLGFALIFSDAMMLFMFLIPIKVGWFAVADVAYLIYVFFTNEDLVLRGIIMAVLVNFGLFYLLVKKYRSFRRFHATSAQLKKRKEFRRSVRDQELKYSVHSDITRHKCAICGRSERDGDELEFRFCSKCNGNYEYCNEHLFTHEHVK